MAIRDPTVLYRQVRGRRLAVSKGEPEAGGGAQGRAEKLRAAEEAESPIGDRPPVENPGPKHRIVSEHSDASRADRSTDLQLVDLDT